MLNKGVILTLLFNWALTVSAQILVNGHVIDSNTKEGLPYVSIGIPGTICGTVSDENGRFKLLLQRGVKPVDSLHFQVIGYQSKALSLSSLDSLSLNTIQLDPGGVTLEEVVVSSGKRRYKRLGNTRYSKNNCTGFTDVNGNWKGSETAVLFRNQKPAQLEYFAFYVIQNNYSDSLIFRLKFYSRREKDWVGAPFNKAVLFRVGPGPGEVKIDLSAQNIQVHSDFFVSLECLMDEMDIRKFCYSASLKVPSYYKVKAFSKWHSTRGTGNGGGGADFNVLISFTE